MPASRGNELVTLLERNPDLSLGLSWKSHRFYLVARLLKRLGFTGANKVLQMFSYGDKNVEVDGIGLKERVEKTLGEDGRPQLHRLFQIVKGRESQLSDMLGE